MDYTISFLYSYLDDHDLEIEHHTFLL